jgi:hypothetical protein
MMNPSVKIALGLIVAPPVAMLLGSFASNVLEISDNDIRDDANRCWLQVP